MPVENPYAAPRHGLTVTKKVPKPTSNAPGAMIGFLLGFLPSIAIGINGLQQHYTKLASQAPDEVICGLGLLPAMAMIFVLAPAFGIIGAAVGWCISTAVTDVQLVTDPAKADS